MRSITIDVPSDGAWVELVPRAGSFSGQVVVVLADDMEVRSTHAGRSPIAKRAASPPPAVDNHEHLASEAKKPDLNYILKRLVKLKPSSRTTAVNSIKAMFQFQSPMSDQEANRTLEDLRKQRFLTIDSNDKIIYTAANALLTSRERTLRP